MKLIDEITVSRPVLRKIVAALKSPNTSKARARGRTLLLDTAEQNWVEGDQIVDLVSDLGNRVWGTCLNDITTLGEMLGLTMRTTFLKPTDVDDEPSGYMGMHLAGVACLLIWLERLGFDMSAQSLCRALAPQIANQEYVSDEELRVLQYSNAQHKMPPISIMLDPFICALGDSEVFELPNGYKVTIEHDEDQEPVVLYVDSPEYIEPTTQGAITCTDCGMSYLGGYGPDERLHNIKHQKVMATLQPKPSRALRAAIVENPESAWVTNQSPKWLRIAVYRRARAFKRELGFDFTQWDTNNDPGAIAYLFHDEDYRIIGSCCFRPDKDDQPNIMRLDWVWFCPEARRKGWLGRHWGEFEDRFGVFPVEEPISDAMNGFLKKHRGAVAQ